MLSHDATHFIIANSRPRTDKAGWIQRFGRDNADKVCDEQAALWPNSDDYLL